MANAKDYLNRGRNAASNYGSKAAGAGKRAFQSYLTSDGQKALSNSLDFSNFGIGGFGLLAEAVGTTWGMNYRLKRGEAFAPALGKELVENTVYGLAPELMVGVIGKAAVEAYPQIKQAANQKKYYSQNFTQLGGDYIDAQSNYASRSRAMEHIKRSRSTIAASVGGEARRHHRT